MSKPIIEVINISKKFNIGQKSSDIRHTINNLFSFKHNKKPEIWALKDVSFEVHEGEVFGLIGPNGSGKSTLLKILSRITYPTSGKAILRGRVSSLLEVGTGFHNELTGRENIYLNGSILGMKRAEIRKKFDEIVDFSGIEQFIDTPVKHYSSGMYVRLAFSVAAHLEPEILLVDEVLSVGDLEFRQKSMGKMNEVAKKGRTVIFVSHNLNLIKKLCQNGLLLNSGIIQFQGKIEFVLDQYVRQNNLAKSNILKINDNDKILIMEFKVTSDNLSATNNIQAGENMIISMTYFLKLDVFNPIFRFEVKNNEKINMFVCNNILVGFDLIKIPEQGKISCKIPKIALNVNQYYIDLIIEDNDLEILRIENIAQFDISPGDFYNTSKMPGKDRMFLVDQIWSIENL